MNEDSHQFHLSERELDYLKRLFAHYHRLARLITHEQATYGRRLTIVQVRAEAEKLRGALTERLAIAGFDEDYALTEEGRQLEDLIDRFYIP
jgi:hypothetical protein